MNGSVLTTTTITRPPFHAGDIDNLDTVYFSNNVALAANTAYTLRVTCLNCGAANSGNTNSVAVIGEAPNLYPGGAWLGVPSSVQPDMYFSLFINKRGWRALRMD